MKILDRYIAKTFLLFLGLCSFTFLMLLLIMKFVNDLDEFTKFHAKAAPVMEYLLYTIPVSFQRVFPLAVVIAVLTLLITLNLHYELIAMQTCGIPRSRLAKVILIVSLGVSVLLWGVNNYLTPFTLQRKQAIWFKKIEKKQSNGYIAESQTWLRGSGGEFYSIGLVGPDAQFLNDVSILNLDALNSRIVSEIHFNKAVWNKNTGKWDSEGYREKIYDKEQRLSKDETKKKNAIDLVFEPKDFIQVVQTPDQMETRELVKHISLLQQSGMDTKEAQTQYYTRYANALGPFILAIIGLCYGFVMTRAEAASAFARGILFGMLYLILSQFSISLGKSGVVPPIWSAWIADIFIGTWGLLKLRKVLKG